MEKKFLLIRCLSFAAVALLAGGVLAQEPALEPPPGPLLQSIPDYTRWEIAYSYGDETGSGQASGPRPTPAPNATQKVSTTKTGQIVHEETRDMSGALLDKWQVGETFYAKFPGQDYWGEYDALYRQRNATNDPKYLPVPKEKFQELEWISRESYAGMISKGDSGWLVFVPSGKKGIKLDDPQLLQSLPSYALVDEKTRLPVVFKSPGLIRRYSFSEVPKTLLTLPSDLQQAIRSGQEKRDKIFSAPQREY